MSDVLIKNMEMPKCCAVCPLRFDGLHTFQCLKLLGRAYTYELAEQRQEDCPLVEVKPHGRLIEADKLQAKFFPDEDAYRIIENEPTVLEASDGHTDTYDDPSCCPRCEYDRGRHCSYWNTEWPEERWCAVFKEREAST